MLNYCEGSYTNIITSQGAFQPLQFTLTNGFRTDLAPGARQSTGANDVWREVTDDY